jgi:hypothetical protein
LIGSYFWHVGLGLALALGFVGWLRVVRWLAVKIASRWK